MRSRKALAFLVERFNRRLACAFVLTLLLAVCAAAILCDMLEFFDYFLIGFVLAFVIGPWKLTFGQSAIVLLTIDGVWLATRGYAEGIHKQGLPPLKEVINSFVAAGGQIWACGACTKPRDISETDLIPGARIVTAANVVECLVSGATTLSF